MAVLAICWTYCQGTISFCYCTFALVAVEVLAFVLRESLGL